MHAKGFTFLLVEEKDPIPPTSQLLKWEKFGLAYLPTVK